MEEYLDLVDKNRKPLNKKILRGTELEENECNVIVKIWITNSKNEILLTKRNENKPYPLEWECVGGCVISGENSKQAIIREVKEEIGINLENKVNLIKTIFFGNQFLDLYHAKADINLNEIILQKEEVCDAKFVSKDEFETLCNKNEVVPIAMNTYDEIKNIL